MNDIKVPHSLLHDVKAMIHDMEDIKKEMIILDDHINNLHIEQYNLKGSLDDLCDMQQNRLKIPHRCPVCNGLNLDEGMLCYPCDGRGIVWG